MPYDDMNDPRDNDPRDDFADPGGDSALRAGKRTRRCPTCKKPRKLTPKDVALGYQCDGCADRLERGLD